MASTTRPSRRSKRLLSIEGEHDQLTGGGLNNNDNNIMSGEQGDMVNDVSSTTTNKRRSLSTLSYYPNKNDASISKISKEQQQQHQQPPPHDADIRKSVPYFLPPPPPPLFVSNGNNVASAQYDPYMRFVPYPMQYHPPPPISNQQLTGVPPPPQPPRPQPLPFIQSQQFPPFQMSIQQFPRVVAPPVDDKRREGSLETLADLSGILGKNMDSNELKQIGKSLLFQQYQKTLGLTSKLFRFVKGLLNGSDMNENIELLTYNQVKEYYLVAKELCDTLGDWKDLLEPESVKSPREIETQLQLASIENSVFGVTDPNIDLVLPPYLLLNNNNTNNGISSGSNKKTSEFVSSLKISLKAYKQEQDSLEQSKLPYGKCDQCEADETIQWRRGPNGERSLCNACGLFYTKLVRKMGQKLAGKLLAQRKHSGCPNDRRVPPALLGDEVVHYYLVEDVETGELRELNVREFSKSEDWFDCSMDPPVLRRKLIVMPLLEKLAEVVLDVSNMNSKYDPSHEIKRLKEEKIEAAKKNSALPDQLQTLSPTGVAVPLNQDINQDNGLPIVDEKSLSS